MSQASSSTARTRRSTAARVSLQAAPLAIVAPTLPPTDVRLPALIDDVTGLPLILCPDCKDVRVFATTTTQSEHNVPRTCSRYWFEEEYVVFLRDNGYLLSASSTIAAASTTKVLELVDRIDNLELNLNKVKEMVGKSRDGMGSCICLLCGCLNVTFLVLAILLVVTVVLK
ncbi:hypothetical protein GQ55_4G204200 [Panicum hallii var. hallii]|uniref:Uncharacterized protein n=1 Tax=Panicum hallii var. hallii TaxID=1504633 RepID=A0A2T7DZ73_9POAL|nr:hypothetical protein GQ55_4G204200 [Panicum hallii var. hallii]